MSFDPPKSRNEAILQNMLGANNVLPPPKGRIEELLLQILQQGGTGGGVTPEQIEAAVEAYLEEHPIDEPFEIPITESGGTYSTTATAADILANKDNCAIVLNSLGLRIPLDYYRVVGNATYLAFGTLSHSPPTIANFVISVDGSNVRVQEGEYEIRSLPDPTYASANDFLCLNAQKQPIWKTVPSYQGGSY